MPRMRNDSINNDHPRLQVVEKEGKLCPEAQKKRKRIKPFRIVLLLGGCYVVFAFLANTWEIWNLTKDIEQLEAAHGVLLEEQQQMNKEMESLNDPEVVEKIARESLGMVKQGEVMLMQAVPGENLPKPKKTTEAGLH